MKELQEQTMGIANDVQALSHELHSSELEYLGAMGGMKSWCKEFGERREFRSSLKALKRKCFYQITEYNPHSLCRPWVMGAVEGSGWQGSRDLFHPYHHA
jgi:hypothetical protein